jgi:uncharacterized membrane protein
MATLDVVEGTSSSKPSVEDSPVPIEPKRHRLEGVDLLRGLMMILMALDHTRGAFSLTHVDPVDPLRSWPSLYLTRWVTHLCAPGFISLAGASVYLQQQRGKTIGELTRLLITRGLWLVLLEVTVISFAWSFAFAPFLQVIWAIGLGMVGLAVVLRLGPLGVGLVGAAITFGHNLLDPIQASSLGHYRVLWLLINQPGLIFWHGYPIAQIFYVPFPWFGVICLGYAFGPVLAAGIESRRRKSLGLATVFATAFVLLRLLNGYGDNRHFNVLPTASQTLMSFFSVQKYPPSLEYVLATSTVLLILFVLLDSFAVSSALSSVRLVLRTYGRVPFAYYVAHLYLIHLTALLAIAAMGLNWHLRTSAQAFYDGQHVPGWGVSLPFVYLIWLAIVAALFPLCLWFSRLKERRRDWWLSYL